MRTATKVLLFSLAALAVLSQISASALAGAFVPGNLVVTQVGADGSSTALNSTATAEFVDEFTTVPSAARVQQIAMPTAASGGQNALTIMGTSVEGFITLSDNGQYLTLGGYNNAPATATPTASANNRVVGRIDLNGNVDTSTLLSDAANGNIRGVVSSDGTNFWTASSAGGVRYTTFGSTAASTQVTGTLTSTRMTNIFSGQLYVSSAVAGNQGPNAVGSGEPTGTGNSATLLTGFPTSGTHSPYDYWFKDANTVYVADDGSAAAGGGIQKWTQSGGTWTLAYTLLNTGAATTAVRGLAGTTDGSGNAVLFATTSAATTALITVTDTGSGSTATVLQTAAANTAFRGVEFIPVPEPTTLVLAGFGMAGLIAVVRTRRKAA